jgi:TolB-like protein
MRKMAFCVFAMLVSAGLYGQQPVVAVAPFDAISGISATDANMITRVFFIRLGNTNKVSLVDRNVVDRVLKEHQFQAGDWSNSQKTAELGKALNTDWIVRGELEKFETNILVTVQFYDIQTFRFMGGADLLLANTADAMNKMDPLVDKLVQTIANSGSRPGQQGGNTGANETSVNMRNNEEIILIAAQNLFKNIPRNSRALITGISGSNEIQPQDIRALIADEAGSMTVIFEEQRLSAIETQKDLWSGFYSDDSSIPIGQIIGANVIITGGVYGTGETRRIVFRALNVETTQIIAMSCVLFRQANTEFINDVEELLQRISNGLNNIARNVSAIAISNSIGSRRNADFIFDMIENNLVNQQRNKIVTRSGNSFDLIRKEQDFQMTGWVSDETAVILGRFISADFIMNMESVGARTQINIYNVSNGNRVMQETL